MAGIVRIHRPDLTPEERDSRMEQIKKATIQYWREVNEEKNRRNQSRHSIHGVSD